MVAPVVRRRRGWRRPSATLHCVACLTKGEESKGRQAGQEGKKGDATGEGKKEGRTDGWTDARVN